jgi:1-acyl-sn-glycerol-3-phosphate acyltransferase
MQDWKLQPATDLGLPLSARARSLWRESGLVESSAHLAWWAFARVYMKMCHRLEIEGRERLPLAAPLVLVANHASHLDTLALTAALPWSLGDRAFPIAAGDTFFEALPVATFAAFFINALPLWRRECRPADIEALRERLVKGPCVYILFPEGTRTRTGQIGRFRPGVGMLVAGTPVPVLPCGLEGPFRALPAWRKAPRFERIRLRIGKPLAFTEVLNERSGWLAIAAELEEAVRALAKK